MLDKIYSFFSLDNICSIFLAFIVYSVIGWIFETLLHIFRDKKAVKRGFLFGPLCPIYGVGAVVQILILYGRTDNIFILFAAGFLISGVLEYTTHFVLEKCFHAMWWDYSSRRFNIKGRVYLNGLIFMGIGAALLIKYIHPFLHSVGEDIPPRVLHIICFVIYSIFVLDVATTIADLKNSVGFMKRLLDNALEEGQTLIDNTEETISGVTDSIKNNERVVKMIKKLSGEKSPLSKFKRRYPDFTLQKYKEVLDIIRDKPDETKSRKDIKLYGEENDFTEDKKAVKKQNGKKNKKGNGSKNSKKKKKKNKK